MNKPYKHVATLSTTTSYQNANTLAAALSGTPIQAAVFADGAFRVPPDATYSVRVCIQNNGGAAHDDASKLLAPGEYLPFSLINLTKVSLKSVGGASTIEFEGDFV